MRGFHEDELRSDGDPTVWQAWHANQLWQLRQPAPPLEFPGEAGIFMDMYAQVREEEQVISPQFTRNLQDVSMRRRKKRKQVEDGALTGYPTQHGSPCCPALAGCCTICGHFGLATCLCIGVHRAGQTPIHA